MKSLILSLALMLYAGNALADELDPSGILNSLIDEFIRTLATFADPIRQHAKTLFWSLAGLSFVTSGYKLIFSEGSMGAFFFEITFNVLILGLFYFLLINGVAISQSIIDSMIQVVDSRVSGPAELLDLSFNINSLILKNVEQHSTSMVMGITMRIMSYIFLIVMFIVILNFTKVYLGAQLMCVAGIMAVGFAGHQYTRYIAISYLKIIIGLGLKLMTFVIIFEAGCRMLQKIYTSTDSCNQKDLLISQSDLMAIIFVAMFLLCLSGFLPAVVYSLATGSSSKSSSEHNLSLAFANIQKLLKK